jgi:hypothetical protein
VLRVLTRVTGVSAVALLLYFLVPLDRDLGALLSALILAALLLLLLPMTLRHALRIEESPAPLLDAAQSLCTLLTLLIVGFATIHFTLAGVYEDQYDGLETKIDGLYYTMSIISTVGFGDITATGQWSRAIVTVQMLFDLIFIGIAVKLLGHALVERGEDFRAGKP